MLDYLLRFLVGGIADSAFAALGDALHPKTLAGLFGAAPSIALAAVLIALSRKGADFVAIEARSMILGALALAAYSWTACVSPPEIRNVVSYRGHGGFSRLVCGGLRDCGHPDWRPMIVRLELSVLRGTSWREHLLRFALGGAATVVAGLIAAGFGPFVGGLFLALPPSFPPAQRSSRSMSGNARRKPASPGRAAARKPPRSTLSARRSAVSGLRPSPRSSGSRPVGLPLGLSCRRRQLGSPSRQRLGDCGERYESSTSRRSR